MTDHDCSSEMPFTGHSSEVIHSSARPWPALKGMLNPLELNFGTIDVDEASSTQTITLSNQGNQPLPIKDITPVGDFTISTTCPIGGKLGVGKSCQISVFFRPNHDGLETGGVYVDTGDALGTEFVKLAGTGDADGGSGGGWGGPAGGVLSGNYPDPGFAVPMATADALASMGQSKANVSHSHPLSQISQSGATTGQVPVWAGSQWVPGDVGSGGGVTPGGAARAQYRGVWLGDSLDADQGLHSSATPTILARLLRTSGVNAEIYNLALNGLTIYSANTVARFGSNTTLQQCINLAPNFVIIAMPFNEAIMGVDSRSVSQIQTDIQTMLTTLRSALPACKIFYASKLSYDSDHASPGNIKNKHMLPALMAQRNSGILASTFCEEILEDAAPTIYQTRFADWHNLDTFMKSQSQIDASFTLPIWKAARLGLLGYDGLHPTAEASVFWASAARKAFETIPAMAAAVPGMSAQNYPYFNDPDTLFNGLLTNSGGGYVSTEPPNVNVLHPVQQHGPWKACIPSAWFLPSKGNYKAGGFTYTLGTQFIWSISGAPPLTDIYSSIDGGAWISIGRKTDSRGDFMDSGDLTGLLTPGTYIFRYKVGNEVFGPVTLTVVAGSGGGGGSTTKAQGHLTTLGSGTIGAATQSLVPLTSSASFMDGGMTYETVSGANVRMKVPRTGVYAISVATILQSATANCAAFAVVVIRNAAGTVTQTFQGAPTYGPYTDAVNGCVFNRDVRLTAGDTITYNIWCQYAASFSVASQGQGHWVTVREL